MLTRKNILQVMSEFCKAECTDFTKMFYFSVIDLKFNKNDRTFIKVLPIDWKVDSDGTFFKSIF